MIRGFRILRVDWQDMGGVLANVREKVFVYEMRSTPVLELDGEDPLCFHVLAVSDKGDAIGTGRIDKRGRLGHIAVLMPWRQNGVGKAILNELIAIGRDQQMPTVKLTTPLSSQDFYEEFDFQPSSPVYMDAGVPCRDMRLQLPTASLLDSLKLAF